MTYHTTNRNSRKIIIASIPWNPATYTNHFQARDLINKRVFENNTTLTWVYHVIKVTLVATPLWVKWEDETPTPKVGDLESSGTPECLEFDSRGQNTSHWGVLGVIGKVLKCRCPKCPCIGHLDICSPSYGQKKGRESNWQFDSRPLKVENRPLPDIRIGSATWRWKAPKDIYNFSSNLVTIQLCSREL
jgi:hypothetical protein